MMIRNSIEDDIPQIEEIYAHAREFMRESGNASQWQGGHPRRELIEQDVREGAGYVILDDDGEICGVFSYKIGEDPTYSHIDGSWANDAEYGTIHRIASSGKHAGVLEAAVGFALSRCSELRIDTHADNAPMRHLMGKLGFEECGTIYLEDGDPRIAYQLSGSCDQGHRSENDLFALQTDELS